MAASIAPAATSLAPLSQGVSLAASADSVLDDVEFASLKGSGSPWIMRSVIALGALAFGFVIYQGASSSGDEPSAELDGVAAKSAAAAAPVQAEPTAWEKEQALLEKARLADEAAAKALRDKPQADAFGASLSGDKPKKPTSGAKTKWRPQTKKDTPSANTGSSQYDPMNGAL